MRRISHDLAGAAQRIAKLGAGLESQANQLQSVWLDDTGRVFLQRHIHSVSPTLAQLVSSLTQAIERFEEIARVVKDPEIDQ